MRFVFFSDLHAHNFQQCSRPLQSGLNSRFYYAIKAIHDVFSYAEEEGIEHVFFGGDLFHDRKSLHVDCLHMIYRVFEKYAKSFKIYAYTGNHDQSFISPMLHSMIMLRGAGVHVIEQPNCVQIMDSGDGVSIGVIPFQQSRDDLLHALTRLQDCDILMLHQGIKGVVSTSGFVLNEEALKLSDLPDKTPVLLGHIHECQSLNAWVHYAGSVLSLDWNDAGSKKFFIDFNFSPGKHSIKFIPSKSPMFVEIPITFEKKTEEILEELDSYPIKGNYCRFSAKDYDSLRVAGEFDEELWSRGALWVDSPISRFSEPDIESTRVDLTVMDVLDKYVDYSVDGEQTQEGLKKIARSIIHEVDSGNDQ